MNKELPIKNHLFYFDNRLGKVYQIIFPDKNEIELEQNEQVKTVSEISIPKRYHIILGELNDYFINEITWQKFDYWISEKLAGTVAILNSKEAYLLDFANNKAFKAKTNIMHNHLVGNVTNNGNINIFQINYTVYYTKSNSDSLYSFTITRSDFSADGIPIYIPLNNSLHSWLIGSSIILGIFSVAGIMCYRNKNIFNKITRNKLNQTIQEHDPLKFTEIEKNLIQYIIHKQFINVDELNNLLGLGKKALEIQKKIRTETLHKINHKFRLLSDEEVELVERVRSEQDRRFYNYTISQDKIILYKNLIK